MWLGKKDSVFAEDLDTPFLQRKTGAPPTVSKQQIAEACDANVEYQTLLRRKESLSKMIKCDEVLKKQKAVANQITSKRRKIRESLKKDTLAEWHDEEDDSGTPATTIPISTESVDSYATRLILALLEPPEQLTEFPCPSCPATLKNKDALRNHIRVVHENRGRWECEECGQTCAVLTTNENVA